MHILGDPQALCQRLEKHNATPCINMTLVQSSLVDLQLVESIHGESPRAT